MTSVLFAFLAGILTVAAPCTLPVLPILLGTSLGNADRLRPVFIALGFVASFAAATLIFSAVTDLLGFDQNTLRDIAVVLLIAFGLLLLWPAPFEWLSTQLSGIFCRTQPATISAYGGNTGGFVLGTTLGLVWTPCAGPVLGSIITVIATTSDFAKGGLLLTVYALGAAVPLLAIAYGGHAVATRLPKLARVSRRLQQGFGVLTITFAVATYYQYDTLLTLWLSGFYPNSQIGL